MGMFEEVHKHLLKVTPERPQVLREMENYAEEIDFPIVGPLVGRLLYQLTILTKARKILELGSGYGYSAFWFSMASGDNNSKNKKLAMDFFKRAGLRSHFDYKVGDSLKIAKRLSGPFDIIFNDVAKKDYPPTIDLAAPLLRKGGLFITDNLLVEGKVYARSTEKSPKAVKEFTESLYKDSRFFTTIMPLRDGVSIAVKL